MKKRQQLVKPKPPRYDKTYYEGLRWLDWIAMWENKSICVHFQSIERGIECTAKNCLCDLYQEEKE